MSPPPAPLHRTMGNLFIGVMVANSLHGISIAQTFYYYRHQNDKWPLKVLVAAVMIFDTIHQGLITHTVYIYVISHWGNVEQLGYIVPSLTIQNIFNSLTALLVQGFLTARVWKLSEGNILLTGVLALFVLAEFIAVTVFSIVELQFETYVQLVALKPLSLVVNILAAVGDILIAASLCFLLHRFRTGFQRSDTMINKLMLFALNTGLLTSLCAVASFVSYMASPNSLLYITFYFCIGRLYTNSLLATLNVRKTIGGSPDIPMSSFGATAKSSSRSQKHHVLANHVPIKIDSTTEYGNTADLSTQNDQKYDSQKSSSNVAVGLEEEEEKEKSLGV